MGVMNLDLYAIAVSGSETFEGLQLLDSINLNKVFSTILISKLTDAAKQSLPPALQKLLPPLQNLNINSPIVNKLSITLIKKSFNLPIISLDSVTSGPNVITLTKQSFNLPLINLTLANYILSENPTANDVFKYFEQFKKKSETGGNEGNAYSVNSVKSARKYMTNLFKQPKVI